MDLEAFPKDVKKWGSPEDTERTKLYLEVVIGDLKAEPSTLTEYVKGAKNFGDLRFIYAVEPKKD